MVAPSQALLDIQEFLSTLKVDVTSPDFSTQDARRVYRRFHAFLLWEIPLDRDDVDASIRLYNRECLADIASSYMLNFMGAYKSARLGLRGSIENSIRVFTASSGVDVLTINSVYELIESCKAHWATSPQKVQALSNMYGLYGELCKTVHSTSVGYMSLRVPFETMLKFDKGEFDGNCRLIDKTLKAVGEGYFLEFHGLLNRLDFKSADYVRDSVEAEVKRSVVTELR